jgi:MATE family multidrug resistance protein
VTPELRPTLAPARPIQDMLRIAIPLACAELGWMLMSVVDNIMVGRLPNSAAAIGAASLGSASFYAFAIFGIGLMSGLDTLVSHAFGANKPAEARQALASGLTLALAATPILAASILALTPLLGLLGVTTEIRTDATSFARILVVSLPFLLVYSCFRRYLQGIHHVRSVTFALVTSNLVNLAGNWLLIYGHWGLPALGVRGSALSTVVARIYLAGILLLAVYRRDPEALRNMRVNSRLLRLLLHLGFPAALTIGFEVGIFHLTTALIATLDPVSLAAHTIALNAASVTYMVPLGISSAAAVSVGRALGSGDRLAAAHAGWTALGLAAVFEVGSAIGFVLLPRQIAGIYTHDPRVISFSVSLFAIAALFQLFDGLQTVATGALRGAGNTRSAMTWNLVCYWAIALPLACILGFELHWGAVGFWDALCLALILIALGLVSKWYFLTKLGRILDTKALMFYN